MPFPKTWVEELVVEWLQLEGYLVVANLPVSVAKAGGRNEVDIVGARVENNELKIMHIETGLRASKPDDTVNMLNRKFSDAVCQRVEAYFKELFGWTDDRGTINYQKFYIATYFPETHRNVFKEAGVELEHVSDFICERVLPAIQIWQENPPHQPRHPGESVTLPESYWLLKLIESLRDRLQNK